MWRLCLLFLVWNERTVPPSKLLYYELQVVFYVVKVINSPQRSSRAKYSCDDNIGASSYQVESNDSLIKGKRSADRTYQRTVTLLVYCFAC